MSFFRLLLVSPFVGAVSSIHCNSPDGVCEASEDESTSLLSLPHYKPSKKNGSDPHAAMAEYKRLLATNDVVPTEIQRKLLLESGSEFGEDPDATCRSPPVYRITATSLYDAGKQHGSIARERIWGWFNTSGMMEIFRWIGLERPEETVVRSNKTNETVQIRIGDDVHNSYNGLIGQSKHGEGRKIFEKLKLDNAKEFPEYEHEIQGIADGAGISANHVWAANLLIELDFLRAKMSQTDKLMSSPDNEHCSDLYAISKGGYKQGFAQGHNEDETESIKPYYYFLSYTFTDVPSKVNPEYKRLTNCAGLTYPGTVFGISVTWNEFGMWSTQNTMHLRQTRPDGLACILVQRRALCEARNMDEAVERLKTKDWNGGVSMNLVDLRGRRMANVETYENMSHVKEVTEEMGNYSHFNAFKHLNEFAGWEIDNPAPFLKVDRQGKVDSLPPMHNTEDIMTRLSLKELFRPNKGMPDRATIAQLVLNGTTGDLDIWTCGQTAAHHPRHPRFKWNLFNFFQANDTSINGEH